MGGGERAGGPAQFLEGGELLLSTGMRLRADDPTALEGLRRALGRGRRRRVRPRRRADPPGGPPGPARGRRRRRAVVLEVPEETPFIAVSKAVSAMVAAQEYEATTRAFETQRDLTRAALGADAVPAVAARLARGLAAWVLVLDPAGRVVAAAPAAATAPAAAAGTEVDVLRARGLLSSSALDLGASGWCCTPWGRAARSAGSWPWGARPVRSHGAVAGSGGRLAAVARRRARRRRRRRGGAVRGAALGCSSRAATPSIFPWMPPWLVVVACVFPTGGSSCKRKSSYLGGRRLTELVAGPSEGEPSRGSATREWSLFLSSDVAEIASAVESALAGSYGGRIGASLDRVAFSSAGCMLDGALARSPRDLGCCLARRLSGELSGGGSSTPRAARAFADSLLAPLDATGGKADLLRFRLGCG